MRLVYLKLDVIMMLRVICQPFRRTVLCFFLFFINTSQNFMLPKTQSSNYFSVLCDQAIRLHLGFPFPSIDQSRIRMSVPELSSWLLVDDRISRGCESLIKKILACVSQMHLYLKTDNLWGHSSPFFRHFVEILPLLRSSISLPVVEE